MNSFLLLAFWVLRGPFCILSKLKYFEILAFRNPFWLFLIAPAGERLKLDPNELNLKLTWLLKRIVSMKHLVKSPGEERRTDIFSESVRMTPDLQNHQVQPNRCPYVYEKNFNPQYCPLDSRLETCQKCFQQKRFCKRGCNRRLIFMNVLDLFICDGSLCT